MPELNFTSVAIGKFVILLLSVGFHESAHAYVAHWLGDPTPKRLGRVTLNPFAHLDLVMSVLLPAFFIFSGSPFIFGAGKPVPVQPQSLKHPARDFALIAVAGPLSNIILALLLTLLHVICGRTGVVEYGHPSYVWLSFGVMINVLLAFFNMIPIPPLDGSRFLAYLFPKQLQPAFYGLDRFGFVILILLLVTGVLRKILDATFLPAYDWWTSIYSQWI